MQRLERARTHTIVSAESMETSSALRPSPPSRLLPLLTGKGTEAEIVIERSRPQTERALRGNTSITTLHTHTPYSDSKKAHRSIISNVQILVRLIPPVIDEGQPWRYD
jgi:hypothetical protein